MRPPASPAWRLGVVGGGQLGQMLGLAAAPLGIRSRFLDPAPDACAGLAGDLITAAYDDEAALDRLADGVDAVTVEFENVPAASLERLGARVEVHPPPRSLVVSQDRLSEKRFLRSLGIATAPFAAIDGEAPGSADLAMAEVGLPAILKTRRLGYDGRGQVEVADRRGLDAGLERLGHGSGGLILEGRVGFRRELATLGVRGADGSIAVYPVTETRHRSGILRAALAPAADVSASLASTLREATIAVLEELGHVGLLAVEWFDAASGPIANEIAPRVHNSGHWTIEGAISSQFENHVRAVLGLPLGAVEATGEAAMVNLLGSHPPLATLLAEPGLHVHLYGKAPRPGRKLGHITAVLPRSEGADAEALLDRMLRVALLGNMEGLVGEQHHGLGG